LKQKIFVGQFTIRISAKHLSKAWRATVRLGAGGIFEIRLLKYRMPI
jgi:hypothetical protein